MPRAPVACGWYGVSVLCTCGGLYASRAHSVFEIAHAPGGVAVLGVARGQVRVLHARALCSVTARAETDGALLIVLFIVLVCRYGYCMLVLCAASPRGQRLTAPC